MLEEEIEELKKKTGKVKGDVLRGSLTYVREKEGEEGLLKIEEALAKAGYPLKLKECKHFLFYPVQIEPLIAIFGREIFGWKDEDIFDIGIAATRVSFLVKMSFPFLISLQKLASMVPQYWKKTYNFGRIEVPVIEENGEGISVIVRIYDYDIHPVSCLYNAGYILGITRLVLRGNIKIEETKCIHKGDPYHEYEMTRE